MNLEQLLIQQKELSLLIAQARMTDEGILVERIQDLDSKISILNQERLKYETALLKLRYAKNELEYVTVREAALITGWGEPSIRTMANPKRPHHLETIKEPGDLVKIKVSSIKKWRANPSPDKWSNSRG